MFLAQVDDIQRLLHWSHHPPVERQEASRPEDSEFSRMAVASAVSGGLGPAAAAEEELPPALQPGLQLVASGDRGRT